MALLEVPREEASSGAVGAITARSRCAGVREARKARPRSSSTASTRRPFPGPEGTSAGLAPRNAGVVATARPADVKSSEMG
ncbi:hypothetical protein BE11_46985 [Sorangium cellulosum]|nr:hypothetical protein BE11_46985 [Sorangium cellulosum]